MLTPLRSLWMALLLSPMTLLNAAPTIDYQIVDQHPHTTRAFTQGLLFDGEELLESSGLYGRSYIARWRLDSPQPIAVQPIPAHIFAEGLTHLNGQIFLLSWKAETLFSAPADTLQPLTAHRYPFKGWGLTDDGESLIASDGSATLRWLDPTTLTVTRQVTVTEDGKPLPHLNELEWMDGLLVANIFPSPKVVFIDPQSGNVVGRLDLSRLYPKQHWWSDNANEVANGIAWHRASNTLFVTGKRWPTIYQIAPVSAWPNRSSSSRD